MPVASWLTPADPAAEMARGAQIGAQIASERSRLQLERQRMQMETQVRQEDAQRQQKYEEARLATENARVQAETGLRQERLGQLQQQYQQKTQAAAQKWAAQQSYAQDIQHGFSHEQALYRNPLLLTPQAQMDAQKFDQDFSAKQLDIASKRQQDEHQRMLDAEEARTGKQGQYRFSMHTDPADQSSPTVETAGTYEDLANRLGTNFTGRVPAPADYKPPAPTYNSKDDVVSAFKAGKLTRADAKKMLTEQFGVKE